MEHWATVLDIIEAGLAGDREKVRPMPNCSWSAWEKCRPWFRTCGASLKAKQKGGLCCPLLIARRTDRKRTAC